MVNIFELENDGQIKDYGTYSNVRNMTSTEEITYENDEITINASEGKLYYEGELEKAQLEYELAQLKAELADADAALNELGVTVDG